MDDMKGMDISSKPTAAASVVHKATCTVKKLDAKAGVVTLAHEPVKSMNWPSMTMGFKVKDKMLMDKLTDGKKVEFEFMQNGKDHVVCTRAASEPISSTTRAWPTCRCSRFTPSRCAAASR